MISRLKFLLGRAHPAQLALLGYLSYIVIGWVLLCLPFAQRLSVSALDNLFISTSAVSTTGLVTVSVSKSYTLLGQIIVLSLIQLGGIGYMTLGSFVILLRKSDLSEIRLRVGSGVFSLPAGFRIAQFIRNVVLFTVAIEAIGAVPLAFMFHSAGVPSPVWSAIFHSVSAFCTAGFSLFDNSFEAFTGHFGVNAVIGVLSYLGAIGFIVFQDLWHVFRGRTQHITLTSRIIIWVTAFTGLGGTVLFFLGEPAFQTMPADERLLASFFQAMTAMTTVGFDTVSTATLSHASILLTILLMVIGASPSGTGGGIKTTTFSAILGVMRSAVRGETEVRFWGRPVPMERIWTAVASLGFYLLVLVIGTYLLEMTEASHFDENLFEAASALGTVGLSMGITASLTHMGKVLIILLMYFGRLGPLTLGMALNFPRGFLPPARDRDLAV